MRLLRPDCGSCKLDYWEKAMCACDTCHEQYRTVRFGLAFLALAVAAIIVGSLIYVY